MKASGGTQYHSYEELYEKRFSPRIVEFEWEKKSKPEVIDSITSFVLNRDMSEKVKANR